VIKSQRGSDRLAQICAKRSEAKVTADLREASPVAEPSSAKVLALLASNNADDATVQ